MQLAIKLKWNSLNHRRDTIRLQRMYKIIHRIVDLNLPDYITFNRRITRRNDYKLTMPFTKIESYKFSFFPATVTLWNQLPNEAASLAASATLINVFINLVM